MSGKEDQPRPDEGFRMGATPEPADDTEGHRLADPTANDEPDLAKSPKAQIAPDEAPAPDKRYSGI